MDQDKLKQIIEVLIFASDEPLPVKQIRDFIEDVAPKEIKQAVDQLNHDYKQTERTFQIIEVAGGYQMVSRPNYAPWVKKLFQGRSKNRLSQAALESLSVIAFRQPVSRTEIDAIRGVNSDGVVRTLLERKLVRITGRAEGPGRPLLYATTKEFLRYFGVNSVDDLPKPKEIEDLLKDKDNLPEGVEEEEIQALYPPPKPENGQEEDALEENSESSELEKEVTGSSIKPDDDDKNTDEKSQAEEVVTAPEEDESEEEKPVSE